MDPIRSDSYNSALAFLYDRINYERGQTMPYERRALDLDRMRELLARLGGPADDLPIVHVAGTKGKGSTSAMIAAMLSAAGYRTGLYTSPHLDRLEERFQVDGQICSADELISLVDTLRPIVAAMESNAGSDRPPPGGPTFFELTTAMALVHFARRRADAAVIEVGLGGRLDSTNVCRPRVTVITSISFDHTELLGHTLAAIAREKAGIIKPGIPLVSGVIEDEPRGEIDARCRELGAPLVQLGRDFDFAYHPPASESAGRELGRIDFLSPIVGRRARLEVGLLGRHQAANAAVALAAIDELARQGWSLGEEAIARGLAEVRWPARVEVVGRRPTVVLDAAHNVASAVALAATLAESFPARRKILVFATTREKDVAGMLAVLLPHFDHVVLTRYQNNPRGVAVEDLVKDMAGRADGPGTPPTQVCSDPSAAWAAVHAVVQEDDLVCVTGSFFIAAEMRVEIARRPLPSVAGWHEE
jgi:dihydrofolate synthase / folylpolyglutamate synthase